MIEIDALASGSYSSGVINISGEPVKRVYKSIDGRAVRGIDVKDMVTTFDDGSIYSSILVEVYLESFESIRIKEPDEI